MFVQANPRKLKFKRVGEYVDGVNSIKKFQKQFFNDAVIIDLVSCNGVK